ncbi:MAG: hypothetical protein IGS03_16235 [Candidatus Sericytochromatia bacterium]|nr:hypothetical protein [Candidatus Sericytochromatia bacterium]
MIFSRVISRSLSLALLASLMACQVPQQAYPGMMSPQMNPQFNAMTRMQARSAAPGMLSQPGGLAQLLPLLRHIYQKDFADALENGQPLPDIQPILEQHGPAAFALLSQDRSAREELYPMSDQMVLKEFSKPSSPDSVPPISAQELQDLSSRLQPGDVILCGNNGSFIHGALYIGNGEIVHALAVDSATPGRLRGVVREALSTYTRRVERDTFVVLRAQAQPAALQQAIRFAAQQVGKPYDSLFLNASDERYYCTELVWQALRQMPGAPRVYPNHVRFGWQMVTVEDLMDSPDLQTIWERNYRRPAPGQRHRY